MMSSIHRLGGRPLVLSPSTMPSITLRQTKPKTLLFQAVSVFCFDLISECVDVWKN